ncbi:hypothetical protein J437_LFUL011797 [Ladona fulva]|uniref:Prenylcysteine lyase domain-containing protein n=1 Tax=Ladona fulva TaxID=123851 RepID=A0A8K0KDL8_LADFU|nr:hypothetical protein J437_LFUL011797 [Ladona fulva]
MTYSTVEELLKSINPDFIEDVQISTAEGFVKEGLSNRTISELVMAGLIVNYGQTTAAHKFVGSVSSATGDGNLWSIVGGNKLLPEKLLKYSGATLINAKVEKIKWDEQYEQYLVSYYVDRFAHRENKPDRNITLTDKNLVTKVYDIVIVAAPLTRDTSNIVFEKLPSLTFVPDGRYHRTVCTIVKGKLNHRYFGERNEANEIYSIKDNLLINSVARIYSVHKRPRKGESEVWKVFSQKPLSKDDLSEMFLRLIDVKVVDWLAYPHYDSNQTLGSFVLAKNLYHVNAIEWAASAMEMSVIGAKNVALLAYKNWRGVNVDNSEKDEL